MGDKMIFGQYYHANSWIHRLDPRCKIIVAFFYMITIFLIRDVYVLLGALGLTLIIVATSHIPLNKFINSLRMVVFILLFSCFFQVVFNSNGEKIVDLPFTLTLQNTLIIIALLVFYFFSGKIIRKFRILFFVVIVFSGFFIQYIYKDGILFVDYTISIYDEGLNMSVMIVLRIINVICISSLLTLTTKPTDLNNGLEDLMKPLKYLKVKVNILSMMISIALRFIPTLINEADRILKAQASRGVDFREGNFKEKIVQIISLLIPMFIVAFNRAEDLANAMEARGYDPDSKRTRLTQLKYRYCDIITYIAMITIFGIVIYCKVVYAI